MESIFCVGVCENNNQQFVWNYASFFRPVQCFMWKRMQPAPSTFFHYTFFWRSVQTQTVACWHWMQQPRIYFVCKNVRLLLVEKALKYKQIFPFYDKWLKWLQHIQHKWALVEILQRLSNSNNRPVKAWLIPEKYGVTGWGFSPPPPPSSIMIVCLVKTHEHSK